MIHGKSLVVVMPAYNAENTVEKTYREIPEGFVDHVVLVDDASRDQTSEVAKRLGMVVLRHPKNRGYGGNQKTCYREALRLGGDVVVMLHPDYQYSPKLVVAMASMIASGQYDVVLGSRILCGVGHPRGDAVVQIRDESHPHADPEFANGSEGFRISHGVSRVQQGCAGTTSIGRKFRRFCVRQ